MPRYSAGARSTGAGSTTLPLGSIYAAASNTLTLREIGVFNTTTTAVSIKLSRASTTGTVGAAITPAGHSPFHRAATATPVNTHTVAPTLTDLGYRAPLAAAIGSGVIWTFPDDGLVIGAGATNGVCIICATGTGQICDFYIVWDE
jgi:hypothetical protein